MPARKQDLAAIFQPFVGRAVEVVESVSRLRIAGDEVAVPEARIEVDQPVVQELRKTALRHKFNLRVALPGAIITMDIDPARLNVHVRKAEDGIWRIADDMHFDGQKRLLETPEAAVTHGTDKAISIMRPLRLKVSGI